MKTFITISRWVGMAIIAGFLFAVASCAAGPSTSPPEALPAEVLITTVPTPEAPAVDLGDIARDAYLDTVKTMSPRFSEAEWLDFAGVACAALDQTGQDMLAAVEQTAGQRAALTNDLAAGVVGAAMGSFYCEHYYTTGG